MVGSMRPVAGDAADVREAVDLLAKSASDSCSICAREARDQAFALLADRFPPGRIIESERSHPFRITSLGENELSFDLLPASIGFRFHTAEDHLVGIAEADWTSPSVATILHTTPPGNPVDGSVEIIPFAYGDGPAFSYSPSTGRLHVHCRVVEIVPE